MSQVGKKDDAEQIVFEHTMPFEKDHEPISEDMAETMKVSTEMAIIGYWKQNKKGEYKCYHYFFVPRPCKRETLRSDRKEWNFITTTVNVQQVIFRGE